VKGKVILRVISTNISTFFYHNASLWVIGKSLSAVRIKKGNKYLKEPEVLYSIESKTRDGVILLSKERLLVYESNKIEIIEKGKIRKFEIKGIKIKCLSASLDGNLVFIIGVKVSQALNYKLDVWNFDGSAKLQFSRPLDGEYSSITPLDENRILLIGNYNENRSSILDIKNKKLSSFPLEYFPKIKENLIIFSDFRKIKVLNGIMLFNFKNYLPLILINEVLVFF